VLTAPQDTMQANVETLGALERRIDLTVPAGDIEKEVSTRLAKLARTVRMPGFRPGKVPIKTVAAMYGAQVQAEVLNDKVGAAFNSAVSSNNLRVAGAPKLEPKTGEQTQDLAFSATFEIYPEIKLGDLSGVEVQRAVCDVGDAEIDKTLEIMRKQRASFEAAGRAAADGDKVTVDFVGTQDGVAFEGGSGTDFPLQLGEGRMLPEFEAAVRGMTAGEKKTFPLTFPADYRATQLAGKTVQFEITVKGVEQPVLPAVDEAFAKSLGIADGDVAKMRAEVKANLEREVKTRLKSRTKDAAMNALLSGASFEVPKSLIQADQERLAELARQDLVSRGIAAKEAPLPPEIFAPQAERRVRLGLLLAELVRAENLQAQQQQIRKTIEEIAQSYERPAEVIQWYLSNRDRLSEIETVVVEDNVVDWVLKNAKVVDAPVSFDELMGHSK
jgi:trigger factor